MCIETFRIAAKINSGRSFLSTLRFGLKIKSRIEAIKNLKNATKKSGATFSKSFMMGALIPQSMELAESAMSASRRSGIDVSFLNNFTKYSIEII